MTSLARDRATTLKTAYRICNVEPLQGEDLERYYVDLSEVRKTKVISGEEYTNGLKIKIVKSREGRMN